MEEILVERRLYWFLETLAQLHNMSIEEWLQHIVEEDPEYTRIKDAWEKTGCKDWR